MVDPIYTSAIVTTVVTISIRQHIVLLLSILILICLGAMMVSCGTQVDLVRHIRLPIPLNQQQNEQVVIGICDQF